MYSRRRRISARAPKAATSGPNQARLVSNGPDKSGDRRGRPIDRRAIWAAIALPVMPSRGSRIHLAIGPRVRALPA